MTRLNSIKGLEIESGISNTLSPESLEKFNNGRRKIHVTGSKATGEASSPVKNHSEKRHAVIKMPYPGSVISENHYLGRGRDGGSFVKAEAQEWQNDLIVLVQNCGVKDWKLPLKIRVEGTFKNLRECPDCQNIKILYDGIQKATGLNDKFYHTETVPGIIDKTVSPFILITIEEL